MFVDTNIFVRILTRDDADQGAQALAFMEQVADGRVTAMTSEGVLVEAVQVLSSKHTYALPRREICDGMVAMITLRGLHIQDRDLHLSALQRYAETKLDYVDCLAIEYVRLHSLSGVVSFDREFDKIDDVIRHAPGSNS